jgi:hypothetical protein
MFIKCVSTWISPAGSDHVFNLEKMPGPGELSNKSLGEMTSSDT